MTLRSRRRGPRGLIVLIVVLASAAAIGLLIWNQMTKPPANDIRSSEQSGELRTKGAIPLAIPGQTPTSDRSDSE